MERRTVERNAQPFFHHQTSVSTMKLTCLVRAMFATIMDTQVCLCAMNYDFDNSTATRTVRVTS